MTRQVENWRLFFTEAQLKKVQGRSGIQSLQEDQHKEDWTNGQEVLLEHGECGSTGRVSDWSEEGHEREVRVWSQ